MKDLPTDRERLPAGKQACDIGGFLMPQASAWGAAYPTTPPPGYLSHPARPAALLPLDSNNLSTTTSVNG